MTLFQSPKVAHGGNPQDRTFSQYGFNIVGKNIAAVRRFYGMSQAALGESIGRDRQFIQRIESGGKLPAEYLEAIGETLQLENPFILTRSPISPDMLPNVIKSHGSVTFSHIKSGDSNVGF